MAHPLEKSCRIVPAVSFVTTVGSISASHSLSRIARRISERSRCVSAYMDLLTFALSALSIIWSR